MLSPRVRKVGGLASPLVSTVRVKGSIATVGVGTSTDWARVGLLSLL